MDYKDKALELVKEWWPEEYGCPEARRHIKDIRQARQKNDQNVNFHFNLPVKFKFDSDKREAPKK